MITNHRVVCRWEDGIHEGVFMPYIPSFDDTIITPRGEGIVTDRIIDAVNGKTIVELKITHLNEEPVH